MSKSRTKLAATWPPTADVAREAGHKPQSPLRDPRKVSRLHLLPGERGPVRPWNARYGRSGRVSTPGGAKAEKPAKPSLIPTGKPPSKTMGRTPSNSPTPIGC